MPDGTGLIQQQFPGGFSYRLEHVEGNLWRIDQKGWADREAGSRLVDVLRGILDDVALQGGEARLWLCADYRDYRGIETLARQRMLRQVVEHPALGGAALVGLTPIARALVTVLAILVPRVRLRAFASEPDALAWLRSADRPPAPRESPSAPGGGDAPPLLLLGQRRRKVRADLAELQAFRESRDRLVRYVAELSHTDEAALDRAPSIPGMDPGDPLFGPCATIETFRRDILALLAEKRERMVAMDAARAAAEDARRTQGEFLGVVSHELRTPLAAVAGYASLLGTTALDADQRHAVEGIAEASRRLSRMVDELLDLTRLETRSLHLVPAPFPLRAILGDLQDTFGGRARRQGLDLVLEADDDVPGTVLGDRDRLLQVLSNLVDNALKFTERGTVRVQVCRAGDEALLFRVRDSGVGIPPEDRERIFRRFERGRSRPGEANPGLGIGLSVARDLVQVMGGTLDLEPGAGPGSTFSFRLDLPVAPTAAPGPARAVPARPPRVLLVEDDPACRAVVQQLLKALGCEVLVAGDGLEAVARWRDAAPDLVLMDLRLPGQDGFQATRAIRAEEARRVDGTRPATVIVAATAHSFDESGRDALAAGMDGFATKPLTLQALGGILQRHLPGIALADPASGTRAAGDGDRRPGARPPPGSPRVLVVDDDPLAGDVLVRMVQACGARAHLCATPEEALRAVGEDACDLLLVDYRLNGRNGIDCLESLVRLRPGTRAFVLSGSLLPPGEDERARRLGMGYLPKPLSLDDLKGLLAGAA